MADLFAALREREAIAPGASLLPGAVLDRADRLLREVERIAALSPFRILTTPGGGRMSAAMTSAGPLGWHSDRRGYRYVTADPLTERPWPPMPPLFAEIARDCAAAAGYEGFRPQIALINRYVPGAKMGLHQDRDEAALEAPIVSISLGLPARFLFGGLSRHEPIRRFDLLHGDAVVWGGPSRLAFHGVATIRAGDHPATGACRINLTFRRVR